MDRKKVTVEQKKYDSLLHPELRRLKNVDSVSDDHKSGSDSFFSNFQLPLFGNSNRQIDENFTLFVKMNEKTILVLEMRNNLL